jgi:hypothetical protein
MRQWHFNRIQNTRKLGTKIPMPVVGLNGIFSLKRLSEI